MCEARAKFKEKFLLMMRSVIWQTKCRRDPEATVWQKHGRLPILLIGGGSRLPFFCSAVGELDAWLRKYTSNEGITHQPVLLPNSLVHSAKRSDGHYYLTVTWGLSHRALDVGEIIPADCIPDADPPPRRDWRSRFVSRIKCKYYYMGFTRKAIFAYGINRYKQKLVRSPFSEPYRNRNGKGLQPLPFDYYKQSLAVSHRRPLC